MSRKSDGHRDYGSGSYFSRFQPRDAGFTATLGIFGHHSVAPRRGPRTLLEKGQDFGNFYGPRHRDCHCRRPGPQRPRSLYGYQRRLYRALLQYCFDIAVDLAVALKTVFV